MDELHELRLDVQDNYRELSERIRKLEEKAASMPGQAHEAWVHLSDITDALGDRWYWSGEDMSPADVRVNALSIVRGMVLDLKRVPKEFEALRAELAAAKKRIEELEFPNGDLAAVVAMAPLLRQSQRNRLADDLERQPGH